MKKARNDTSTKARFIKKEKRKIRKNSVVRTRNANTWTEAEFFSKIRSALRKTFRFWKPMKIVLKNAERIYTGNNKLQKFEYQCNECKNWFKASEVEVDHIEEAGSLKTLSDIPGFIERLTKEEPTAYQVLCKEICHKTKTQNYLTKKRDGSN